ncbi:SDR family NAD(P)-dependent oxidoreductase [Hymenobacter sp. 15J16-1T3B]|uniref:SDR family NAD(P)-dependent oxidoreductase n=1 Tax=Hymenobacter sp. 15J16-1T3B TaxID=2886941 RepID=UPI001D10D24A|nr:SDR family NAD(P)-dependent oxidoreductase [Hymenobacter sp. 15J16-1T3B]MCC3159761.1 SDR family NAD(P)-dependent oxidoreductase [Hymenobacter sp. 15J16-1T3B]
MKNSPELITTPFGFGSTADDVVRGVDLSGQRAIVTGASSGIGIDTARALAGAGAEVTLAVRNVEAGRRVAADLQAATGHARVLVAALDLSELASVRAFVAAWRGPLHILVNNAGVMALPELTRTAEGREMQFATNFLGHFALTLGLHEALAAAGRARVVSVSSSGNLFAPVFFDDPDFHFLPYNPLLAYGQSKSACALLAVELTRRWAAEGIYANALNPGAIATNLQKHTGGLKSPPELHKTPAQGAATSVLLAASPLLEGIGGRYFEDCNEAATVFRRPADYRGVAAYALNAANAERLWCMAQDMIAVEAGA